MKQRYINFKLNENELIKELFKFFKWVTEKEPTKEEKGLIADYVMIGEFKYLKELKRRDKE